jgi:hypothetical protein
MPLKSIAGALRLMHALKVVAALIVAAGGIDVARAGELHHRPAPYVVITRDVPYAERSSPSLVYDFEPGVIARAYWLPPWRHRHYFPFGADRVAAHRLPRRAPRPAETFERYWSADSFLGDFPPLAPPGAIPPGAAPPPLPPK